MAGRRDRSEPSVTAAEIAAIHMPPPSYWPLILALGMLVMISGLLVSMVQVVVGGLWTLVGMYKFAMEHHRSHAGHGH